MGKCFGTSWMTEVQIRGVQLSPRWEETQFFRVIWEGWTNFRTPAMSGNPGHCLWKPWTLIVWHYCLTQCHVKRSVRWQMRSWQTLCQAECWLTNVLDCWLRNTISGRLLLDKFDARQVDLSGRLTCTKLKMWFHLGVVVDKYDTRHWVTILRPGRVLTNVGWQMRK